MEEKTELQPYSVLMSVYSGENADFLRRALKAFIFRLIRQMRSYLSVTAH